MVPTSTGTSHQSNWRTVRHYAYLDRPYEAAWTALAQSPHEVLGAQPSADEGTAQTALTAKRGALGISRTVTIRFGGLVCEEEMARMALRWQDSHHAMFFPVFEGILSLAPMVVGRRPVTQVGLVGRYRPPLGAAGAAADRLAGGEVADEVLTAFVDGITARLEALIPAGDLELEAGENLEESDTSSGRSRILITLDQLADHRGGAVALTRQLEGTPGVTHAEVNPIAGIATVEYDPDACSLSRILAELEVGSPGSP
jgi:copper chaperone CopZ